MGEEGAAKYIAEFVGTFMLILTVGCNVLTGSPVWAVTSIACTLMVSIYALGGVSAPISTQQSLWLLALPRSLSGRMSAFTCFARLQEVFVQVSCTA